MSITQSPAHSIALKRVKAYSGILKHQPGIDSGGKSLSVRNHRSKGTFFLSEAHALNAIEAAAFAQKIGHPLNHAFAVHFAKGNMTRRAQDFIGHYLRMASQWLTDRGATPTYIWTLEHSTTDPEKGLHLHALVHVPRDLGTDFRKLARGRWALVAGINPLPGVVHIEPVGGKGQRYYDHEHRNNTEQHASYCRSIKGAMRYALKSIDPSAPAEILATDNERSTSALLRIRTAPNEMIYGRRISLSRNIGTTARLRWAEKRADDSS